MEEPWELAKLPASAGKTLVPTVHKNEDRVIIACPKRVDVYAIPESKCVESWSLDRGSCLSSAAVQSQATGSYFIAHDGGAVYQWDETASCHSDWLRHEVHGEVKAVHLFEDVSDDALLVMEDGSAEWLTKKKEGEPRPHKKHRRSSAAKVPYVWSGVWLCQSRRKRVVVISCDGSSQQLKLSILCINSGESPYVISSHAIVVPDGSSLVDCCLLPAANAPLVLLFSDGQIAHFDISKGNDEALSLSSNSLVSCFRCKCDGDKCCIVAVDRSHVAVVGVQECSGTEMAPGASVWDVPYSTRVSCRAIEQAEGGGPFRAVMVPGNLVVVVGQRVLVVPYQTPGSTLASVIGCSQTLLSTLQHDALPIVSTGEWTNQTAMEHATPPPENGSRHPTLQQCLDDDAWSRDAVEHLLKAGSVAGSIVEKLVERLQTLRDYQLLSACVRHVPDLSESVLVSILSSYVQCLGKAKKTKLLYGQVQAYFDQALACSYNAMHLRDELRQLPVATALKLVTLIHARLSSGFLLSDQCQQQGAPIVDVRRQLTWLSLILDAQAAKIILDTEAKSTLKEVNDFLKQVLQVSFQLRRLAGPLDGLKQQAPRKHRRAPNGHYQIEVLHI